MCVELVARSNQDLEALDQRIRRDLEARGLQYLGGSADGSGCGCVTAGLVAATPEEMDEIGRSYDDIVQLTSFLQPL